MKRVCSNYFTCCFHLFEKQPVTKFPCTSFTGPHNSVLPRGRTQQSVVEAFLEGKLEQRVKVVIPLIQGVTAPLSCRVLINPHSYVLISSSSPVSLTIVLRMNNLTWTMSVTLLNQRNSFLRNHRTVLGRRSHNKNHVVTQSHTVVISPTLSP